MSFETAAQINKDWDTNPRWKAIRRPYSAADVVRLRGSVKIEYTLARLGAEKLWRYLHEKDVVRGLGALTGNQAMQQVKAGLDAIYLSGWQVRRSYAEPAGCGLPSARAATSSWALICETELAGPVATGSPVHP